MALATKLDTSMLLEEPALCRSVRGMSVMTTCGKLCRFCLQFVVIRAVQLCAEVCMS
jgi:hypothetical protein